MLDENQQPADPAPEESPAQDAKPARSEHSRIEELESQVRELSSLVEVLMERPVKDDADPEETPLENPGQLELGEIGADIVDGVRSGMERMLGVEEGETLESRIGSTWLPRGAVLLFMTLLVLGIRDDSIPALYKIVTGYAVSTCFVAYGIWKWKQPGIFAHALMGTGLATLYFTTYALFYLPETKLIDNEPGAMAATLGIMLLVGGLLYRTRSETATGITFLLILYTVALSLLESSSVHELRYAFATGILISAIGFVLMFNHRLVLSGWIALAGTYGLYTYHVVLGTTEPDMPVPDFYHYAIAFLAANYLFATAGALAHHTRNPDRYPGRAALVGISTAWMLYLVWYPLQEVLPDWRIPFHYSAAAAMMLLAVAARGFGSKTSMTTQAYICSAIVLFAVALEASLQRHWFVIALSAECFAIAVVYKRLALTVLKTSQFFLIITVFLGSLSVLPYEETILYGETPIPLKWIAILSAVVFFTLTAWYYDHRVAVKPATLYAQEDHWFLANHRWNWSPSVMAVINTTFGALILIALTIYDLGNSPTLPFVLAGEGLIFALIGLLLGTPQMELSSVLLIVSSHVTYHFFWFTGREDFPNQPYFISLTVLVALISYLGSYFWERYLRRIEDGAPWEHDLLSSIPFVASTLVLITLFERVVPSVVAPVFEVGLGCVLMAAGALSLVMGVRIAAVTATLLGCGSFYIRSLDFRAPNTQHPQYLLLLFGLILMIAITERMLYVWERRAESESTRVRWLHHGMIVTTVAIGMTGLWHAVPQERLSLYWTALGVATLLFGVFLKCARYRFMALAVIFIVIGRLYLYDLSNLTPVLKLIVFSVITAVLLLISWGYARLRKPSTKSGPV